MKTGIFGLISIVFLMLVFSGCNSAKKLTLSQVPVPARTTIEKLTAGGQIMMIEKEKVDGQTIYDVEATVKDKDVEYDVASDGTILTSAESIPYDSLPAAIQQAAQKYFGSVEGLAASKELEKNKTYYEVEGKKGNKLITLKLDQTGKITEKEKE